MVQNLRSKEGRVKKSFFTLSSKKTFLSLRQFVYQSLHILSEIIYESTRKYLSMSSLIS